MNKKLISKNHWVTCIDEIQNSLKKTISHTRKKQDFPSVHIKDS